MPKKPKPTDNDLRTTWTKEADALTYEEAFQALDLLLVKLQDDSLAIAEPEQPSACGDLSATLPSAVKRR